MRERIDTIGRLSALARMTDLATLVWNDAKALVNHLVTWQIRARERKHLASLDERMLRDVGLSRADIARESSKPFWLN